MNVVKCGHCDGLVDRTMHHSDVVDFMRKFEIDYNGPPRILPPELLEFREKLESEEHYELLTAATLEEQVDALIDKLYVTYGTLHLMGVPVNKCWERVHRANMSKVLSDDPSKTKRGHAHDLTKPEGWQPPSYRDIIPDVKVVRVEKQVDPPLCEVCKGEAERVIGEDVITCSACDGTGFQLQQAQPNATSETTSP